MRPEDLLPNRESSFWKLLWPSVFLLVLFVGDPDIHDGVKAILINKANVVTETMECATRQKLEYQKLLENL